MLAFVFNPTVTQWLSAFAASTDPITSLVNYGLAGIVVVLLVTGQLRTKAEVAGLQKALGESVERERQKDLAMTALMNQITQHTLPQMTALTDVLDRLPQAGDTVSSRLDDMARTLARMQGGA